MDAASARKLKKKRPMNSKIFKKLPIKQVLYDIVLFSGQILIFEVHMDKKYLKCTVKKGHFEFLFHSN